MADVLLLRALQGNAKSVNLSCKKLKQVPRIIGKINGLLQIDLKGNKLEMLPEELGDLKQLEQLNLGNNSFTTFPNCISYLYALQTLHFFQNSLQTIPERVFTDLRSLTLLNLNNNQISQIPRDICRLINLQKLSIDNNALKTLPIEICALTKLKELRLSKNQLERLPLELGFLSHLEQLHVPLNKLKELPEVVYISVDTFTLTNEKAASLLQNFQQLQSIGKCYNLKVLDVAANQLRIFPTETQQLPLTELHYEGNPLLSHVPVHSVQEEEVLSLKEISARYIMRSLKDRFSILRQSIKSFPELRAMLAQSSQCAVCGEPFLNTWLECVHFVTPRKMKLKNGVSEMDIPIRALLCSYTCFNKKNHEFYGVAFP